MSLASRAHYIRYTNSPQPLKLRTTYLGIFAHLDLSFHNPHGMLARLVHLGTVPKADRGNGTEAVPWTGQAVPVQCIPKVGQTRIQVNHVPSGCMGSGCDLDEDVEAEFQSLLGRCVRLSRTKPTPAICTSPPSFTLTVHHSHPGRVHGTDRRK